MTDFHVEVVSLGKIEKHPNADALDITYVHGETGYPCIVKKDSFKEGDLAVYIPVEVSLPDRPEFAFLNASERRRLRAKKLRGFFSMGLVIPVPSDVPAVEGTDVAELMGITKFEPKLAMPRILGGDCEPDPEHFTFHRYTDIEPLRRNSVVLTEGEEIVISEKCHGSNARFCWDGNRLWVGSRMQIKKHPVDNNEGNVWWRLAKELDLETKLARVPGHIFYGEVFGPGIQDLTYGQKAPALRIFDILDTATNQYLDHDDVVRLAQVAELPMVPHLYRGPWKPSELLPLAEGKTTLGEAHCREGFVVKPLKERWDHRVGRVILKMVGEDYHMRKQK